MSSETSDPIQSSQVVARLVRFFCLLVPVAAPCLGSFCMLQLMGFNFSNYGPGTMCNDEVGHFLQAQAFAHDGFQAGYFGVEEQTAPVAFSHYGVHGPVFPMISGLLGKLFGISFASAYYFNLIYLTVAVSLFVLLVPMSNRQLLVMAFFLLVYWPFYFSVYAWMQECLQYAIAIVLAACFHHLLISSPLSEKTGFRVGLFAFLCLVSLLRISWSMFFIPLFLFYWPGSTRQSRWLAALASCPVILGLLYLVRQLCSPFPSIPTANLMTKLIAWEVRFDVLLSHIKHNFAVLREISREGDVIPRTIFLLTLGGLGCLSAYYLIQLLRSKQRLAAQIGNESAPISSEQSSWLAFNIYNLGAVVLSTIVLYHVGGNGGLRIFSVHLLLMIMLAFASRAREAMAVCAAVILVMCLTANSSRTFLKSWYTPYFEAGYDARLFHDYVKNVIVYEPGADGWSNTILTRFYPHQLAGLPAGIGTNSYFCEDFLKTPIKSRYIITTPELVAANGLNVKLLLPLNELPGANRPSEWPVGSKANLYLNLNSGSRYEAYR